MRDYFGFRIKILACAFCLLFAANAGADDRHFFTNNASCLSTPGNAFYCRFVDFTIDYPHAYPMPISTPEGYKFCGYVFRRKFVEHAVFELFEISAGGFRMVSDAHADRRGKISISIVARFFRLRNHRKMICDGNGWSMAHLKLDEANESAPLCVSSRNFCAPGKSCRVCNEQGFGLPIPIR